MSPRDVTDLLGEPASDHEGDELDGQRITTFRCEGATGVVAFHDNVAVETTRVPNQAAGIDGGNDLVVVVELKHETQHRSVDASASAYFQEINHAADNAANAEGANQADAQNEEFRMRQRGTDSALLQPLAAHRI